MTIDFSDSVVYFVIKSGYRKLSTERSHTEMVLPTYYDCFSLKSSSVLLSGLHFMWLSYCAGGKP